MIKRMNHGQYMASLKGRSDAMLRYIITDAREAVQAMPDGPNAGYYADEISYASMEIQARKTAALERRVS